MKHIMIVLALSFAASLAFAKDIPVDMGGKTITVKATTTNREIVAKDMGTGDQKTPLGCSLLYYSRLSKGDIAEASNLSTAPKATAEKWEKYRERTGVAEFKKDMAAYFTSKNVVLAELTLDEAVMLVVKTADYTAGQIYVKQNDKWLMAESLKTEAGTAFGKILSKI
ncbi:MAG: hypothetical protein NTV46_21130 [Verrucomicrobia bacterium]|nr:hypothetical protein [Verrucomicrobiota bacterium]